MSAPYPTDAPATHPAAPPPAYHEKSAPPPQQYGQPAGQPYPVAGQPYPTAGQPYPAAGQPYPVAGQTYQPTASGQMVIVTQPQTAGVVTYQTAPSPHKNTAIWALVVSICVCVCFCWVIGLVALILAIIAVSSNANPESQRKLSIWSFVFSGIAFVVGLILLIWLVSVRESHPDSY